MSTNNVHLPRANAQAPERVSPEIARLGDLDLMGLLTLYQERLEEVHDKQATLDREETALRFALQGVWCVKELTQVVPEGPNGQWSRDQLGRFHERNIRRDGYTRHVDPLDGGEEATPVSQPRLVSEEGEWPF